MNEDSYTICGASSTYFYSYAVLDLYGATIVSGCCNGEFIQIDKTDEMKYIVVSGKVSDIETLMVLDAPKSEVGPNPEYIPCDDDHGGGSGDAPSYASLITRDISWDGDKTYTIRSFTDRFVDTYSELPDDFVVYIEGLDSLVAGAKISLFNHIFEIEHINGRPIETTVNTVPKVFPLLFHKSSSRARTLYSFVGTNESTGLHLEDIYLDLDE